MKNLTYLAILGLLVTSCASLQTVRLDPQGSIAVSKSEIQPIVLQFGHSEFFVSRWEIYSPTDSRMAFVKLGMKSNNIDRKEYYDFSKLFLKIGTELRAPAAIRYFPGDYPFGFGYGGGRILDHVNFNGDGRFTIILGYLLAPSDEPEAVVYGDVTMTIPRERLKDADITDGFPVEGPKP